MTGRERLTAMMKKEDPGELSWTTLIDDATLNNLPETMKGLSTIDFYRYVGCDILLLNGWATGHEFSSPTLDLGTVVTTSKQENGCVINELRVSQGSLTKITKKGHPIKYYVETLDDLRIFRRIWENAHYLEGDDQPVFQALNGLIGEDGLVTRFWGPSTIPKLLEEDMGTTNFYYLLNDYPEEMDKLIQLMHEKELKAFEILSRSPCEFVILCEDTSTLYISPKIYRRYNGPHVQDFVEIIKAAHKIPIIHMCGHIKNLLPDIKKTGLEGIHGLTPPPTGDTPWELALEVLGEDQIIVGVLDPYVFEAAPIEKIAEELTALYTPRMRNSHFILWVGADGHCVPFERFQAVARWMELNGNRV